jgi:tRNA (guanine10-N2)-methyltransferase
MGAASNPFILMVFLLTSMFLFLLDFFLWYIEADERCYNSRPGYIAPKKPYGFEALQNDILDFAAQTLVNDGRLSMWMPTANDEDVEFPIPMHPNLEVLSVSVQPFNNCMPHSLLVPNSANLFLGSRRLITYRRLPEGEVSDVSLARSKADGMGMSADDLNEFRRKV